MIFNSAIEMRPVLRLICYYLLDIVVGYRLFSVSSSNWKVVNINLMINFSDKKNVSNIRQSSHLFLWLYLLVLASH